MDRWTLIPLSREAELLFLKLLYDIAVGESESARFELGIRLCELVYGTHPCDVPQYLRYREERQAMEPCPATSTPAQTPPSAPAPPLRKPSRPRRSKKKGIPPHAPGSPSKAA